MYYLLNWTWTNTNLINIHKCLLLVHTISINIFPFRIRWGGADKSECFVSNEVNEAAQNTNIDNFYDRHWGKTPLALWRRAHKLSALVNSKPEVWDEFTNTCTIRLLHSSTLEAAGETRHVPVLSSHTCRRYPSHWSTNRQQSCSVSNKPSGCTSQRRRWPLEKNSQVYFWRLTVTLGL